MAKRSTSNMNLGSDVLARYGAFYQGDDDLFAHCLILRNGRCVLLFQGLQPVTLKTFEASESKHGELVEALAQPVPSSWSPASYQGYNFVTDPEGPNASEVAVYVQPQDSSGSGAYYAAPADSDVASLVKAIADIDLSGDLVVVVS
jgi:hypothetical protein